MVATRMTLIIAAATRSFRSDIYASSPLVLFVYLLVSLDLCLNGFKIPMVPKKSCGSFEP